jgi:hypothetical protein
MNPDVTQRLAGLAAHEPVDLGNLQGPGSGPDLLEHFPAKPNPVGRKKMHPTNNLRIFYRRYVSLQFAASKG